MNPLDDAAARRALDPGDMSAAIASLPEQCRDAWAAVQSFSLPDRYRHANAVIILGMGGSAIGGALLQTLVEPECAVPVVVCRDYHPPAWVGPRTLAIASSYSGDTEETLAAFEACLHRGAMPTAMSTGGKLRVLADGKAPFFSVTYRGQPRAALGHSLIPLLGILYRLGFVTDPGSDLGEAIATMQCLQTEIGPTIATSANPAKQLATRLHGRIPFIYGAAHLSEVGRRWKGQINENAKGFCTFDTLPELNHNTVVGYEQPATARDTVVVAMLRSGLYHPRVSRRFDITRELLLSQRIECEEITACGRSRLAQMLATVHFGDYVSYYLALLNGVDPSSVDAIQHLKACLARE